MSQFSVLGQCCRYDENHGKWRKRAGTACLSCVFNHHNSFKTFFCPMNNHRQRFWQKTTWATIMSQDDKTCIIACWLLKMPSNLIHECVPILPYNYASESKKVFDISLTVSMGHLIVYIPVPRWHRYLFSKRVPSPSFSGFKTFPVYFPGLNLCLRSKVETLNHLGIHVFPNVPRWHHLIYHANW